MAVQLNVYSDTQREDLICCEFETQNCLLVYALVRVEDLKQLGNRNRINLALCNLETISILEFIKFANLCHKIVVFSICFIGGAHNESILFATLKSIIILICKIIIKSQRHPILALTQILTPLSGIHLDIGSCPFQFSYSIER